MQTGVSVNASVFGMMGKIIRDEGFFGLYRGVTAPLLAMAPMYAVSFWGYDMGK